MPIGLVTTGGSARRVLMWNREADLIFGCPLEALPVRDLPLVRVDRTPYPEGEQPVEHVLATGEPVIAERALVARPDGTWADVRINAVPMIARDGAAPSALLIIEDVSIQTRHERDARLLASVGDALSEVGGDAPALLDATPS